MLQWTAGSLCWLYECAPDRPGRRRLGRISLWQRIQAFSVSRGWQQRLSSSSPINRNNRIMEPSIAGAHVQLIVNNCGYNDNVVQTRAIVQTLRNWRHVYVIRATLCMRCVTRMAPLAYGCSPGVYNNELCDQREWRHLQWQLDPTFYAWSAFDPLTRAKALLLVPDAP